MLDNNAGPKNRLNYTNNIDSVHCVVGANGSGKTRLLNSLLEKDKDSITRFYKHDEVISDYSFIKYSASVELNDLNVIPSGSIDISTSAYLNTMDLVNLNREDSIKQVKVISDYFNEGEEDTKWQELIELSGKTVSLKLNKIGEAIDSYGNTYLKGTNFLKEIEDKITNIPKYGYTNKVLKILMRKFFAILATDILPLFKYSEKEKAMVEIESNKKGLIRLVEQIDLTTIQIKGEFYKDLEKFLKIDKSDHNIEAKITKLSDFFEDLGEVISNVGKDLSFTADNDRKILKKFFKSLSKDESDNWISQEVFSVLEFKWNGLSSGELALINLFGRLNDIKNITGENVILLLDEVDLGLHPEWQRKWVKNILPIISNIMKKENGSVRVILATHSPIILSDFMSEDIEYLSKNDHTEELRTFGQNIYSLFKNSFFLEAPKGAFSQQVIEDLLKIFGNSSNDVLIQERAAYEEFISKYSLQFDKETPGYEVREFFEELIDMIGEDIIRNHLKKQIKKVRWNNVQKDSLDYEKKIEKLEEQIKELKEKILKPEEENND